MNDTQYLSYCREQFRRFSEEFTARTATLADDDGLRELALAFKQLTGGENSLHQHGQVLVTRLFTTYPDFSPTFPREMLWFLGGDCLHYMPDEEIELYQQLEQLREEHAARGEILDLPQARAKLLKLQ